MLYLWTRKMHPAIVEGLLIHQKYVLNGENVRLRPLLLILNSENV